MKRSAIVSKKKIKISAAALVAAAFAIVLVLLEVAFFVSAIPAQPEFLGKDYCVYENEKEKSERVAEPSNITPAVLTKSLATPSFTPFGKSGSPTPG